jgi:RNA polymerase sigma-70 factor (ECF subfamily)
MKTLSLTYSDEIELIDNYIINGSNVAANSFVRRYQSLVYQVALRYVQNKHDAEDISQEVFIKALSSLAKFKRNSSISTWLYRITVNQCKNYLLKKKVRKIFSYSNDVEDFYDLPNNELNAQDKMENEEFKNKFYQALNSLPEKQRETFALRYFDELPYEEISKLLGTSVGGLKANYFQAVKKLGVYLNEK